MLYALQQSTVITANSKHLVRKALALAPGKTVEFIPNSVDGELFQPGKRDEELAQQLELGNSLVIGFSGEARIKKGLAIQLLAFEKTSQLVKSGIYRYIRHPLYSSLLLLAWGIFFKSISWPAGLLALAATAFLFLTARADEAECLHFFGPDYKEYMQHTRRFIPFIF